MHIKVAVRQRDLGERLARLCEPLFSVASKASSTGGVRRRQRGLQGRAGRAGQQVVASKPGRESQKEEERTTAWLDTKRRPANTCAEPL